MKVGSIGYLSSKISWDAQCIQGVMKAGFEARSTLKFTSEFRISVIALRRIV